jgi:hypothetical protein
MSTKSKTSKKAPVKKPTKKKARFTRSLKEGDGRCHISTIENPVAVMWDICEKMKNKRRRDVLKAAAEAGIAFWTARTQYQLWMTASRNSR